MIFTPKLYINGFSPGKHWGIPLTVFVDFFKVVKMAISVLISLPNPFFIKTLPSEPWKWFSLQNSTTSVFHPKKTKAYHLLFLLIFQKWLKWPFLYWLAPQVHFLWKNSPNNPRNDFHSKTPQLWFCTRKTLRHTTYCFCVFLQSGLNG